MASTQFTQGTKEFLIITVVDQLGQLGDLTGTSPTFDVKNPNGVYLIQNLPVSTIVGMTVYCLIDTTVGSGLNPPAVPTAGWWAGGDTYNAYLKFTTVTEVPRLGPFAFSVTAT